MVTSLTSGLTDAVLARLILLANHVLSSEPAATQKLQPFAGRSIDLHVSTSPSTPPMLKTLAAWLPEKVHLQITPAGLLERLDAPLAEPNGTGLRIAIEVPPPWSALQLLVKRERPQVSIDGDAALAEAASWLMKNLRWDLEDDLARWLGTPPAQILRGVAEQVRQALSRWRPGVPPR